eukprot:11162514-Lingulodinium_polyedra.AAC.1
MAKRTYERLSDESFMAEAALQACIDQHDLDEIKKGETAQKDNMEYSKAHNTFIAEYREKKEQSSSKQQVPAKRATKKRSEVALDPNKFPQDGERESMLEFVPPPAPWGWTLSADAANKRWLISNKALGSCSRSWKLYGQVEAAKQVLQYAWKQHAASGGQPCPFFG